MNNTHLIGCGFGLIALVLLIAVDRSRTNPRVQSSGPLEGTLYRGEIPELAKADPPLPEPPPISQTVPPISISQSNLAKFGVAVSSGPYVVNVISDSQARYALVPRKALKVPSHSADRPAGAARSTTASAGHNSNEASSVYHFKYFDRLIESSDTTALLHGRYQDADLILEVSKLLKWQDLFLLKLTIENQGDREFFISGARVLADHQSIQTQDYLPFSCRPGESEEGIVGFSASSVLGKQVSLEIMESGHREPRLEIKHVDYSF